MSFLKGKLKYLLVKKPWLTGKLNIFADVNLLDEPCKMTLLCLLEGRWKVIQPLPPSWNVYNAVHIWLVHQNVS